MKKQVLFLTALTFLSFSQTFSQNNRQLSYNDSLTGFDEKSLLDAAPFRGITAEEIPFYLAVHKREYIKQKYNIKTIIKEADYSSEAKNAAAYCVNEDFEEASLTNPVPPATINITTSNAINGWTVTGGNNSTWGATGNCTNTSVMTATPNTVQLISPGPAGHTDAIIGPAYKIYSVFGPTTTTYPGAASMDPFNHYGDWFVKLNNQVAGSSVNQLRKTFVVTPSNVIFNFAYMALMMNGHCCCDNGAISIVFKDCLGNMLASASQFSITAGAGTGCFPMGTCSSPSTIAILAAPASNPGWFYSKWTNSSIDLTAWMGQCITVQVTTFDCPYSGHAGYAYFDAQCAPTIINGINSLGHHASYKVYPNPTTGSFNIDIEEKIDNGEMELHNVLGQVILKQNVDQGNNIIKTENLAKGIYNYSILQNKEIMNVGKVVIE
jgi:hypothetical protein